MALYRILIVQAKAIINNAALLDASEDAAPDAVPRQAALSTFVEVDGDKKFPLSEASLREEIFAALGATPSRLGMTRYSAPLRERLTREAYTKEAGAIPPGTEYDYSQPCGLAHPGLCRTADAFFYERVKIAAKDLRRFAHANGKGGTMILVSFFCEGGDMPRHQRLMRLGHCRNGNPAVALFACYRGRPVENDVFQADLEWRSWSGAAVLPPPFRDTSVLDYAQDTTILARGWRAAQASGLISFIEARVLRVLSDKDGLIVRCSHDDVRQRIFPPPKMVRRTKSTAARQVEKGLAGLAEPKEPKMKIRSSEKIRARRGGTKQKPDYSSGPSSGTAMSEPDATSSDHDDDALAVPGPAPAAAGKSGAAASAEVDEDDENDDPNVITWRVRGCGVLKLSIDSMMLGAHCPYGGKCRGGHGHLAHGPGPCRLNRALGKGPVGFLTAWLRAARPEQGRAGS